MEIIVSGRHYQVTPEFKQYSEQVISSAFSDPAFRITNVRLVLSMETKELSKADIVVGLKGHAIEASSEDHEMGKAITLAVDKAAKQAMKHMEKIQDHKKNTPVKIAEVAKAEAAAEAE